MLAAIVGLLLILTIAIGFLGLIAAPQLRSGKRILAPGGERVVATAAAAPVAAGRGTLRGLIASWRASIATAHWFQRIWHPVSEAIHGALDRLEDRDAPVKDGESRPAVVGAADLTARMGHSQPRGHTRSATAGRAHPASGWLGKTGEIPLRDISVPSDPLPSDDGDRPFVEPFAEAEVTRPMAPVPGAVPASAGARSNTRSPLPSTGGISTPGLAAAASPKKTDAKKSVVQAQPVVAKVGADAPAARTAGRPADAPVAHGGGRSPGTDAPVARGGGHAPGADAPVARGGRRAPSADAPAARGATPGSAAAAAPGAASRPPASAPAAGGGSAAGQGGTPASSPSAPKGPRRARFDVAAIVGNRGQLREAARNAVERLDPKPVAPVRAAAAPVAPVAPSDETVMIQPVKAPVTPAAEAAQSKQEAPQPAAASVPPSDETVMIEPVRAPIAAADEVVRFAPIKEPVARSRQAVEPKAPVTPSDETVKIDPVREPVAKAEPAVAPSDATVMIPPVVEPKAAAEKAAAEKAAAEKAAAEKAAAEKAAAEKAAAMDPVPAEETPLVAQTVVMPPVTEAEPQPEFQPEPKPQSTSEPQPGPHAETEVIEAIDEPVATGAQAAEAQAAGKGRNGRSRGKKARGGKVRNGR